MAVSQDLADFAIVAAATKESTWVSGFGAATSLLFHARFSYGSGGTATKLYVQTTLDDGTTPVDIACMTFTTLGAVKLVNLSARTPKTTPVTPTDGTLTDDTSVDGIIGDKIRVKAVSTGTYAASTAVSIRVQAH